MTPTYQTFAKHRNAGDRIAERRHRNRWWMGLATILIAGFCGTGLAIAIEAGMTFKYEDSPELFNSIFIYMGFPGRCVEYLYQSRGSVPSMRQWLYGDHLCVTVNAIAYTVVLLAWFLRPGENRIKRSDSPHGSGKWHHLAD